MRSGINDITIVIFEGMKTSKWLLLILVWALPLKLMAWGMLGHRVIGGIAEHYLSVKARAEIRKLLGNETIAMAGNWADFIRSDRAYDYLGSWHYINVQSGIPERQFAEYLKKDTSANLYNKIRFLTAQLKSRSLTVDKRVFYLKLLIHFVGDAHQPMHAGRPHDRGGNGIKLYWFNTPTNLHRLWDEQLVEFQQLSYTEHVAAINHPTPSQLSAWRRQSVEQWLYESYSIAQKLYEVKPEEKLSYQYNYRNVDIMNQQLLKGGVRLAVLLNEIFS